MTHIKGGTPDEGHPHHTPNEAVLNPPRPSKKRLGRRPSVSCFLTQTPLNEAKDNLIRFVKAPDGLFIPDLKQKLPAQEEIHLKADVATIERAFDEGLFKHCAYSSAQELCEHLVSLLETLFYQHISLSRRSGDVVFGYEKMQELVKKNKALFVLTTDRKTSKNIPSSLSTDNFKLFGDAERYGQIFARERVVYITFIKQHFIKDIKNLINRMEHLRIPSNHAIPQD